MYITDIIPNFAQVISIAILALGILAFTVSIITQVIKNVWIFAEIPTNIIVFLLSIIITGAACTAVLDYYKYPLVWYTVAAIIVLGFFVAFIAMEGWKKFMETFNSFYKKDIDKEYPNFFE